VENESGVSFGDDLGEDTPSEDPWSELDLETYPDATPEHPLGFLPSGKPRKRRKRGTAGSSGVSSPKRPRNPLREKAAQSATILYGGFGVILAGTGLAPAAGFSMQGLADEAGMPIAEWAEKRSPRFYAFLIAMSEATGVGKFVGAPVAAEGYVRIPPARPALEPVVAFAHDGDPEFMQGLGMLRDQYDAMVEEKEKESRWGFDESPDVE
jgi:hypothetical protein